MDISFYAKAWSDYRHFQEHDPKIAERINELIKDISRSPFSGIGKPEPLRHNYAGYWSRRINHEHRLVYAIKDKAIYVLQCRYHY